MGQIEGLFDAIIFNSSFHHCDHVSEVLANVRQKLHEGGSIVLVNEPVLKIYRTKSWFYRTLKENPEKVGHYGGNEHIYRYGEYVDFLQKAGFNKVRSILSLNYGQFPKRASWDSSLRYAVKKIYYHLIKSFVARSVWFADFLKRLSLLNTVIFAQK